MDLVFGAPRAFLWLGVVAILLVPLVLRSSGTRRGLLPTVLRTIAIVAVALSAAGLALARRETAERLCVTVTTDVSESDAASAAEISDRWLDTLARELSPADALGAVAFARHAEVVAWPSSPPRAPVARAPGIDASATRLAAGIEASLPLCPEGSERKVLLVTDGNETIGDARRAADLARQMGVELHAVIPRPAGDAALTVEKLLAPPLVRQGSTFPLRVVVRSANEQPIRATLEVGEEGASTPPAPQPPVTESVEVEPGLNVFEVPRRATERGSARFSVRLASVDGALDERRDVAVSVTGPIRALVVTDAEKPALARALAKKDVEVEFRKPGKLPPLDELVDYHCVVLDDVPRAALAESALDVLETYVRKFGGGLVLTGGARSFGDKAYQKSPLEHVLPVAFVEQKPPSKERKPMGVFLVVDRSNSMTYSGRQRDVRDGEKMRYAKQAARALVDQLADEDHVGVIAFDSEPYVIGGLRPLREHRRQMEDRIERLLPGGGTDFKEALEIAGSQLAADELSVRHILLLTDGDSNRGAADHWPLVRTLAGLRISVTTLRIGLDDVNLELLREISRLTGGRFYHVQNLDELPQLLVRDTKRAEGTPESTPQAAAPAPDEDLAPKLGPDSEVLRGFTAAELPRLRDPVKSRPKPDADVLVSVDAGDRSLPVLATWQVGLGRAAAFPLDPNGQSGERWAGWNGYGKLWSQLVRWVIREQAPWEPRTIVRYEDERAILEVEMHDDLGEATIAAEIFPSPAKGVPVPLTPVAARLFRGALPPLQAGRYPITLVRKNGEQVLAQKADVVTVEAEAGEGGASAELARKRPDRDLLREVTARTGGKLDPEPADLLHRAEGERVTYAALDWLLLPLALVCFLGDVGLRQR